MNPYHSQILNYVIHDCYEEDYCPYTAEYYSDNFCFTFTFIEWYFRYRKININKKNRNAKYKHTPKIILIGHDLI